MATKLYVIGNGFDLHHRLKTSYYHFAQYLKENYPETYNLLERYISYPISDNDLWARFEENLANLDVEEIMFEYSDSLPDYTSDDFRDRDLHTFSNIMEEHYQNLSTNLFDAFTEFIQQIEFTSNSWKNKIAIDKNATFLTFNYTNTLEKIYNIDSSKILYIHNSAFYGSESIVLGHGVDPEAFEDKKVPPPNLSASELEEWYDMYDDYDYPSDEGRETLMMYFKDTYKPTKDIINQNSTFFKSLDKIDEIHILGHSLSPVDLPYFMEIAKNINPDAIWNVSYYGLDEKKRHLATLTQLGIPLENIILFELDDLQENNKQLKIPFPSFY